MAAERSPTGGCDFPVDPDIAAPSAPVHWRPEIAPAVVTLVAATPNVPLQSVTIAEDIVERRNDGRGLSWVRLRNGATIVGADTDIDAESLSILIPIDDDWSVRVAAADRLRRQLVDRSTDSPITPQRRERLTRALRCIDGRRDGATYRAIATSLFGAGRVAEELWKVSSLKAQMVRLAGHGRMLIDHGYRQLLRGKRR